NLAQLGIDLARGTLGADRHEVVERPQPLETLALTQPAGARRIVSDRLSDDEALRLCQPGRGLAQGRDRLLVERKRNLDHTHTISPYSSRLASLWTAAERALRIGEHRTLEFRPLEST